MIVVVLPAFNEAPDIAALLTAIRDRMIEASLEYRVVLVNDGSTDETVDRARSVEGLDLEILDRSTNLGLAQTIQEGLVRALETSQPEDVIVTMDADNTHSPGLILPMYGKVREGFDLVIASRYRPGARVVGLSTPRRFLSWAGNLLFRALLPIPGVKDYTCGYRAYLCGSLQRVIDELGPRFFTEQGFTCMPDILLKLRGRGLVMGEVPILLRYDRKASASKMNVSGNALASLRLLAVRRMGRLE